jgi:hypothetical protein
MTARLAIPTPSIAICEPAISIRELETSDHRAVAFTSRISASGGGVARHAHPGATRALIPDRHG